MELDSPVPEAELILLELAGWIGGSSWCTAGVWKSWNAVANKTAVAPKDPPG